MFIYVNILVFPQWNSKAHPVQINIKETQLEYLVHTSIHYKMMILLKGLNLDYLSNSCDYQVNWKSNTTIYHLKVKTSLNIILDIKISLKPSSILLRNLKLWLTKQILDWHQPIHVLLLYTNFWIVN